MFCAVEGYQSIAWFWWPELRPNSWRVTNCSNMVTEKKAVKTVTLLPPPTKTNVHFGVV